jgi:acyltransferase
MKGERVHWIDIAKGIGIIFIIYGHMLGSQDYRHLLYSFHIPLFFFLSGAVYNPKKYINFFNFLKKSSKSLLLPYLAFAFIFFAVWLAQTRPANLFSPEIIRQFLSIFYANSNNNLMIFNNLLWFLPVLFATRLLFALISKYFTKIKSIGLILIFFSVFGYLFSVYAVNIKLPFGIETALSSVVFYGAGYLWNQSGKAKQSIFKYKYLLLPLLLITGFYISNIDFLASGHQIDMRLSHLNNYFYFYFAAFCGIFAWISFSQILNKNSLLEKIGRNTLILFVWHQLVFTYLSMFLNLIPGLSIIKNMKTFIPLIYTLISITVILSIDSIYNKLRLAIRATKNYLF